MRSRLQLLVLAGTASWALACTAIGTTARKDAAVLPGASPAAEAVQNLLALAGEVSFGGGADLAGNAGSGLAGNAGAGLSNSTPLASVAKLSGSNPMAPVAKLDAAPLGASSGLIGNAGAGLAGNAGAGYRAQADDERVMFVEVVDPATGKVLARVKAASDGTYNVPLRPFRARKALIVQATGVAGEKITSFLAAPVRADAGETGTASVNVTPATTMVALTYALLSGVRSELDVRTGFRGLKTSQLAALVANTPISASQQVVATLDRSEAVVKAETFDQLLAVAASGSAALAQSAADQAKKAGGTLADQVAVTAVILGKISEMAAADVTAPEKAFEEVGQTVTAAEVAARKADVIADAARASEAEKNVPAPETLETPDPDAGASVPLEATPPPAGGGLQE